MIEISNDDKELTRIDKERQNLRSELNNYDTLSQRNVKPQTEMEFKQVQLFYYLLDNRRIRNI